MARDERADVLTLGHAEALLAARQPVKALLAFNQAEEEGAPADRCAGGRWTCYMLLGEYERAWEQSDAMRARGNIDPHRVWDGTSLIGKSVMVRSVHGFGDAVQMLRYAPLIRSQSVRLTVQVDPRLVELARCFPGINEVVAWEEERPFDVQLEITELPYIFRSNLHTLPGAPYLVLPTPRRAGIQPLSAQSSRKRVGLVWTGGAWNKSRSVPFSFLLPLLQCGDTLELWSLQAAGDNSDWHAYSEQHGWPVRQAGGDSIESLAAAIAHMDLVISIDSLAAHLAGALGVKVWVLLRHQADWRWMIDRHDSPWYPSMRLFRQPAEGDWHTVITQTAEALAAWLGSAAHCLPATPRIVGWPA